MLSLSLSAAADLSRYKIEGALGIDGGDIGTSSLSPDWLWAEGYSLKVETIIPLSGAKVTSSWCGAIAKALFQVALRQLWDGVPAVFAQARGMKQ